jgi:DNA-binding response OmpR family regulator
LEQRFTAAGALVVGVRSVDDAVRVVAEASISAAVIDCRPVGGDCRPICKRLNALNIPIVFYSELADARYECGPREVIPKDAPPEVVVDTVTQLLAPA